jgi:hypothetical protein
MKFKIFVCAFVFFLAMTFFFSFVSAVTPFGANVSAGTSERASPDSPQGFDAQAGNVTELNIFGYTVTQSWQGYFGNVTGVIQLSDGSDNSMYNWSLVSPEGEVYASTSDSIQWKDIECFNFTATGTYADDSSNAGGTSLYGTNISLLESAFNITSDDVDGVDETFTFYGEGTHDLFYTNNLEFSEGECRSTRVYSDAGTGESNAFEEVLLYDSSTQSVVFASLLEEDLLGFDARHHDFEMLVLEDGHGTDTSTTQYYFYVELQ